MMIDKDLMVSNAQALTTTAASTDYIDQQVKGQAIGEELYLVCRVGTALTGGTSVTIALQCDDNTSFSSPTTLASSAAILTASLTANTTVFKVRVPAGTERYLRVYYTISGTYGAGTMDAFFTLDPHIEDVA